MNIEIILFLVAFYFAMIGWGRLFAQAIFSANQMQLKDEWSCCQYYSLLGLSAIFITSSIYHWFAPISIYFSILIMVFGGASFISYLTKCRRQIKINDFIILTIAVSSGYWLQSHFRINGDSLLYHTPLVLWHQSEPVVFGLANLHDRLGFNSAWLMIASTIYIPGYGIRSIYIGQALLFMLFMGYGLRTALLSKVINFRFTFLFYVCVLGLVITTQSREILFASTSTDAVSMLLVILSGLIYLDLIESPITSKITIEKQEIVLLTLASVAVLAVLAKLSALPILGLLIPFLLPFNYLQVYSKFTLKILLSVLLMTILWIAQNMAMTGCFLYPVSFTCINSIEWSVGSDATKHMADIITAWARKSGPDSQSSLGNFNWVHGYFIDRLPTLFNYLQFFGSTLVLAITIRYIISSKKIPSIRPPHGKSSRYPLIAVMFFVSLIGIIFWSMAAPDTRFGWGFFLLFGVTFSLVFIPSATYVNQFKSHFRVNNALIVLPIIFLLLIFMIKPPIVNNLVREFSDENLLSPTTTGITRSGEVIYLSNPNTQACGIAKSPCTCEFTENLSRKSFLWFSMWKVEK